MGGGVPLPEGLYPQSPQRDTCFRSGSSRLYKIGPPQLWGRPSIQKLDWPQGVRNKALEWSHYDSVGSLVWEEGVFGPGYRAEP